MDLIYFFKVLFRRKWVILGLAFIAGITTFFFLLNKKPLYVSSAQYSTGFTTEKVRMVDGSSAVDMFSADVKFNNAIETFKSPKVINAITYKLMLHDLENPDKPYKPFSKAAINSKLYKAVNKQEAINILRKKILNNELLQPAVPEEALLIEFMKMPGYDYESIMDYLVIEREGRTDYLNTVFRSNNPELSALVVNGLGTEFLNYYKNLSSQRTEENAQGIKKMLTQQQSKVDSIGKLLYKEKVKQGSIDPISLSTSAMETVKELESRLAEEKSKQNEHSNRKQYLEQRLRELQAMSGGASSGGSSKQEVINLTNRKNKLVSDLAEKGGNDPALQKQIDDLRDQINAKLSSGSSGSKNKNLDKDINDLKYQISEEAAMFNAANSTIADYTSRIRKYTGMANNASLGSDVTIDVIKTQLDMENVQLGNYMEKYSQAEGLVKDDPTANFIQTKVGQQAIDPESKKTLITMILASMAMFFLSSIIFLFLEIFDPTLKTPTIFKKQMKMNLVSVLNHVPLKKKEISEIVLADHLGKKEKSLAIFKNNIRKLRYTLLHSDKKLFLFSSTQQAAGKTTVIEALAHALLLSKKKVLLIDLNFSNNALTQKYAATTFIQSISKTIKAGLPIAGQKISSPTNFDGLDIIGCEQANVSPDEALHDINLEEILTFLKTGYDYILIEAAALNTYSDARELAAYADAVYVVFSADDAVDHADDDSLKFIAGLGTKNKGAILNNVLTENLEF